MARFQSMRVIVAYRIQAKNPTLHIDHFFRRDAYTQAILDIGLQLAHNSLRFAPTTVSVPYCVLLHDLQLPGDLGFGCCVTDVVLPLVEHDAEPVSCVAEEGVDSAYSPEDISVQQS